MSNAHRQLTALCDSNSRGTDASLASVDNRHAYILTHKIESKKEKKKQKVEEENKSQKLPSDFYDTAMSCVYMDICMHVHSNNNNN